MFRGSVADGGEGGGQEGGGRDSSKERLGRMKGVPSFKPKNRAGVQEKWRQIYHLNDHHTTTSPLASRTTTITCSLQR